jgi:hypothetical protein
MAIQDLKSRIARLPEQPGVYAFINAAGETLYVGKARSGTVVPRLAGAESAHRCAAPRRRVD